MYRVLKSWAALRVIGASTILFGLGGGCLPEDFYVDKFGEIVNGVVISALNLALAPSGLAI